MSRRRPGRSPPSPRPTISTSRASLEAIKGGIEVGRRHLFDVEVVVKDSQSDPNRAAEVAKELIVDDEIDMMLVASTPETINPVSTQCEIEERAVHLHQCAVAALVHRPAGRSGRRSAGVEAVRLHLSLLLGPRGHHRRLPQHVEPARHQQDGRRPLPQRRRRQCLGRSSIGVPPAFEAAGYKPSIPAATRTSPTISRRRSPPSRTPRRDRHRRRAAARLHHLLEPGQPAGLQAEGGSVGKAILFPTRSRRWARPATTCRRRSGGRRTILSSRRSPASRPANSPRPSKAAGKQWTQPIGFVHSLFEVAIDVHQARRGPKDAEARSSPRSSRPISTRSPARCSGTAPTCRPSPPRTSPRRRSSAASGG